MLEDEENDKCKSKSENELQYSWRICSRNIIAAPFPIFSNRDVDTPFQVGEENIFQLIPWQEIDGLIVLSHSFCKPSLRKMVTDFCRQSNLPYLLDAEDE